MKMKEALKVLTATTRGKIGLACAVAVIGGGAATGGVVYHNAAVARAEAAAEEKAEEETYEGYEEDCETARDRIAKMVVTEDDIDSRENYEYTLANYEEDIKARKLSEDDALGFKMFIKQVKEMYDTSAGLCDDRLASIESTYAKEEGYYSEDFLSQIEEMKTAYQSSYDGGDYKSAYDVLDELESAYAGYTKESTVSADAGSEENTKSADSSSTGTSKSTSSNSGSTSSKSSSNTSSSSSNASSSTEEPSSVYVAPEDVQYTDEQIQKIVDTMNELSADDPTLGELISE